MDIAKIERVCKQIGQILLDEKVSVTDAYTMFFSMMKSFELTEPERIKVLREVLERKSSTKEFRESLEVFN